MTGVDKDLAYLKDRLQGRNMDALVRVEARFREAEAELSRLRELCVAIDTGTFDTQRERAEAAEARLGEAHRECARLESELRSAMGSNAALQQALEAARREAGRAQDVRANRTRIIGNIALIVDEALAGQPTAAEGPDTPAASCEKCRHAAHEPGRCGANVGTGYHGPVLCRCGAGTPADSQEDKT